LLKITKKLIKPRKPEKKLKKSNREKKLIKILKKLPVQFYKSETKKLNRTQIEKTRKNRFQPKKSSQPEKPSQTDLNQFLS